LIGPTRDGPESVDTELVELLVRRAVCCPCPHPARIAISYDAGTPGEERAQSLRAQIQASRHDMSVALEPGATSLARELRRHFCVIYDATRGVLA